MATVALVFLVGGLVVGFLTGTLGIGGGVIIVPIVFESYRYLGAAPKAAFVTAVASSLAVIIFTGSYASWLHYRAGRLDLRLALWMGVGTVLGAFVGSHVLLNVDNRWVRLAFGIFLWTVAGSLLLPKASPHERELDAIYRGGLVLLGLVMGTLAALFGIGGTALAVPVLIGLFGLTMHAAIAASTSMIVVTALFGSISYIATGWNDPSAPTHGVGWIDPVAVALFIPGAALTTRHGIRLAQGFSRVRLRNMLMLFQIVVGARFIFF